MQDSKHCDECNALRASGKHTEEQIVEAHEFIEKRNEIDAQIAAILKKYPGEHAKATETN